MLRPQTGLEIDGFTLGQKLHEGGFASIWAVTHALYRTPMVMKVPTILDGYDGPTIVGFEVEQMIMPRLTGPHVPRILGQGDFTRLPYIVQEMIPGASLQSRFDKGPWPLSDLLETAARIAEAVHALHLQHVAHLDLKPANILQRPTGEMVLIDFGLARHDELPDLLEEEFAIPMGTWPYIAPEQYLRQRDDMRSDLFALGAMIYEMATGHPPFGMPQALRQVRRRLWRDPMPPRAVRPEVPEWLQEVILRALEVDPAKRYQSAAQLRFDLRHPGQVTLTERARKLAPDGWGRVFARWRKMRKLTALSHPNRVGAQIGRAPILLVAVDLSPEGEALAAPLLSWVRRMLTLEPDSRVACVNVIRAGRLAIDAALDALGENMHVARLVRLKAWAEELDLPEAQLTFTILEGTDPAQILIDHATQLGADHILMGARGHSTARRYLGSVSSKVVAEAAASVTVIRQPAPTGDGVR
jgi:non-specific serine/threonine protein kinase/protein-serine/threonine kinase